MVVYWYYNIANKLHRAKLADRTARVDPGSAGTILVGPIDNAVVECTGAGTRTLQDASKSGLGTTVLCLSQTAAVVIAGAQSVTIGDGEFVEFICAKDSSGDHEWQPRGNVSAIGVGTAGEVYVVGASANTLVAPTPVDITGDTSAYVESIITDILGILVATGLATDSTTT